jgi:hypothetical protein
MNRWSVIFLLLAGSGSAFGQAGYVWDYSGTGPYIPYTAPWVLNGDSTFGSVSGGSAIWPNTVSGANSNDYELNTTIFPTAGGGTYMHFLRAGSTTVL